MGKPTRECDLVMKGGITSGVVYPLAIQKLAKEYRFRSIGGASAGAIAAATAAAAEYRRQTSSDQASMAGFEKLATLPDELGEDVRGRTRLSSLFQPTRKTKRAFEVVLAATSKRKVATATRLVAAQPAPLVLSVLLGFGAGHVGWSSGGGVRAVSIVCGALIVVVGLLVGVLCAARAATKAIENNNGGLCPGYQPTKDGEDPPLTTWLTDLIHGVADVPRDNPLTFGQLTDNQIELVMMTTNLTHGRPHRMPFHREMLFFKRDDMARLFPPEIVKALVDGGEKAMNRSFEDRTEDKDCKTDDRKTRNEKKKIRARNKDARDRRDELKKIYEANDKQYYPLPDYDEMPVIVAVRMSLSFPILLSAVPLYQNDYTREDRLGLKRCWFSDGGICSNLPIHFFDQLVPSRPTFALNLRPPHSDHPLDEHDEAKNIYLPRNNNQGFTDRWNDLDGETLPIAGLLGAMIETMQSWSDNMLTRAPGFRDRVVHIHHSKQEGGLNLEMEDEVIKRMGRRGEAAGIALVEQFTQPITGPRPDGSAGPTGWDNHVWLRYRSALGMLQGMFDTAHAQFFSNPGLRAQLDALIQSPPSYDEKCDAKLMETINETFDKFPTLADEDLATHAPRPAMDLRPRPRDA